MPRPIEPARLPTVPQASSHEVTPQEGAEPDLAETPATPEADQTNQAGLAEHQSAEDRKSTRLNSSHANISYAVFCLKKKIVRTMSPLSLSDPTTRGTYSSSELHPFDTARWFVPADDKPSATKRECSCVDPSQYRKRP